MKSATGGSAEVRRWPKAAAHTYTGIFRNSDIKRLLTIFFLFFLLKEPKIADAKLADRTVNNDDPRRLIYVD